MRKRGSAAGLLTLLGMFAGMALLLAVVGMYGMIAYTVAQRTQELGIRCALGARRSDILRLVMGQGLTPTPAGAALGMGGALAATRVMESLYSMSGPWIPRPSLGLPCC